MDHLRPFLDSAKESLYSEGHCMYWPFGQCQRKSFLRGTLCILTTLAQKWSLLRGILSVLTTLGHFKSGLSIFWSSRKLIMRKEINYFHSEQPIRESPTSPLKMRSKSISCILFPHGQNFPPFLIEENFCCYLFAVHRPPSEKGLKGEHPLPNEQILLSE